MKQPEARPLGLSSVALALMISALWGGTPVAIRFSLEALPPVAIAGVRFALAALFMLFWCWVEGSGVKLRAGQVGPSFILGVMLFLQITSFNIGLEYSNASHGSLFINTCVFWVLLIEHFVTGAERLSARKLLGVALAAGSVFIVLTLVDRPDAADAEQDRPTLMGDLILLASAFLLGFKIVYTRQALKFVEPGKLILWHDLVGVGLFAAYSLIFEEAVFTRVDMPAFLGLFYQGVIVAGFCFAIQATLMRKHSASQIAVFSFTSPLFGITAAVLLRGDTLSPWFFVSGLCVALGILLVTWPTRVGDEPTPSSG